MAVESLPIEAGHVLMFARSIGDPEAGTTIPATFVQASAQFDPDYPLRPQVGRTWFGSGKHPSGLQRPAPEQSANEPDDEPAAQGERRSGGGGGGTGLHAEQHYTYHRPLRIGDVLTATTRPGERWEKQGRRSGVLQFAESITEYRDQDGELVVTARSVGVRTERAVEQ
jgi:N-terminal half of MaoC dehydratase